MLKNLYEYQAEELRYLYQRIGFQCFTETLFEDAGKHLFNGELDPRLLVSYYPELRGSLFTADDVMDVFAGVAEHMPQENSVDDISQSSSHFLPFFHTIPPLSLSPHSRTMFLSCGTDFQLYRT